MSPANRFINPVRAQDPFVNWSVSVEQKTDDQRRMFITKMHANLFSQACISSFWGVSGHLALQKGKS